MMVRDVCDFEPAKVLRNYAGSRVKDVDYKFYNKLSHFPFLITP